MKNKTKKMEDKLELLTECEKLALPLALFAMEIGRESDEAVATTKTTNISFNYTELKNLYGKSEETSPLNKTSLKGILQILRLPLKN